MPRYRALDHPDDAFVREVWKEYTGWFRMESTTELYDVPPSAVWPDLVALAGSPDALAERAHGSASSAAGLATCSR